MDKKYSLILTGKTQGLNESITVSAQKISDFGKTAMNTSEIVAASFSNITVSAEKTEGKLKKLSSGAKDWMKAAFSVEAVKRCISALSNFLGKLTEISRKASELGTSASFFKNLKKLLHRPTKNFPK